MFCDNKIIHIAQKKKTQVISSLLIIQIILFLNYNCGPATTNALPASFPSYLAKFLIKRDAKSLAFSSHCAASAYVSRGSRIPVSTPSSSVGTSKLKYGIVFVSAFSIAPLKIPSIIPRVSLIEIRFPVPFH